MTIHNDLTPNTRTFRVVVSRTEEDDGYMADIPSLNNCTAFGDTVEEALENLHEVLEMTLEMMQEYGWLIPDDNKFLETTITVPFKTSLLDVKA